MGDANYEYGKMQETMAAIYDYGKNGNLVRGKVRVGDDEIFYISHRDIEDDVRKALNTIATHDHLGLGNWIHSRDWIGLYEALKERREHPGKVKRLGQSREDAEHLKELIKNGKDPRLVEANSKVLRKLKEDIDWTEANQERPRWRAGGIELNNQFLFFIEQPMWEKMSKLLRVDVAAKAQKQ
jgi:hypothetical protein